MEHPPASRHAGGHAPHICEPSRTADMLHQSVAGAGRVRRASKRPRRKRCEDKSGTPPDGGGGQGARTEWDGREQQQQQQREPRRCRCHRYNNNNYPCGPGPAAVRGCGPVCVSGSQRPLIKILQPKSNLTLPGCFLNTRVTLLPRACCPPRATPCLQQDPSRLGGAMLRGFGNH